MSDSVISLPASLEAETAAFLALCDEAHVTVIPASSRRPRDATPWFTELRNIVVRGRRYADKVAACGCSDLRLFIYAGSGYTVCAKHGLLEIGHVASVALRANGRKRGI